MLVLNIASATSAVAAIKFSNSGSTLVIPIMKIPLDFVERMAVHIGCPISAESLRAIRDPKSSDLQSKPKPVYHHKPNDFGLIFPPAKLI